MKLRKAITSMALTGVIATASIIPCGTTIQCAQYQKETDNIILPCLNTEGTDISYEITANGVSYSGSSYAYSYTSGDYTYFSVGFTCTSGGCTAQVNRVYELDGKIHVDAYVKRPGLGQMATCVMTYPYVTGRIAKTDKPVVFDGAAGNFNGGNYM